MISAINPALPALALGKPEAVIEVEKPVTVIIDAYGRPEKYDGVTITELSNALAIGFGSAAYSDRLVQPDELMARYDARRERLSFG